MAMKKTEARQKLIDSLTERFPTWDIASAIVALKVIPVQSPVYNELVALSSTGNWMFEIENKFESIHDFSHKIEVYSQLFPELQPIDITTGSVNSIERLNELESAVQAGLNAIGIPSHVSSEDALKTYREYSWGSQKKRYLKRVRFLHSFDESIARAKKTLAVREAKIAAKSRLASSIDASTLDDVSLSYVAYLVSRASRRTMFQVGSQSKAFDNISDALYKMIDPSNQAVWGEILKVSPTKSVFLRAGTEKTLEMMVFFNEEMKKQSEYMAELYSSFPERMRKEMVMVKGVDSSAWNAHAGAYNTMRSAWIASVAALGLTTVFDEYLPGKAVRLMASDVVWMNLEAGKSLHPDTVMFDELPKPWHVISGDAELTRDDILVKAADSGIDDAVKSGWVNPRTNLELEVAAAEPALLHGVIIYDVSLLAALKKQGLYR